MGDRFDVVVFGASGFTGQYVVSYLAQCAQRTNIRYAVAGRNRDKLQAVLDKFPQAADAPIIIADVKDQASLDAMCGQARVVIACVGPYRFFGEPVVRACVANSTSYVDISGEPEFIENMQFKYHDEAKSAGSLIVSTCGFDSIPADIGTMFTVDQFPEGVTPSAVESFLTVEAGPAGAAAHFATWESAVHGFATAGELRALRRKMPRIDIPTVGPRPPRRTKPFFEQRTLVNRWSLPFPGSDASVVKRSQQFLAQEPDRTTQPVHYSAYFTVSSFRSMLFTSFMGTIFQTLAGFACGRNLLLKYVRFFSAGLFSHEGPTEEQMADTRFRMTFLASGYTGAPEGPTDYEVQTEVSGPEPGYVATPIFAVESALTMLDMNNGRSGVLTPAAAFRGSNLVDRLQAAGIGFAVKYTGRRGGSGGLAAKADSSE